MIREGIEAIGTKEIVIQTNSKDQSLVKKIASKLAKKFSIKINVSKEVIECAGGVVVSTPDKTTIFSNTVEERLERMKPILRRKIADLVVRGG
jgi:V/A-type H+-transporting ATPase subunit E